MNRSSTPLTAALIILTALFCRDVGASQNAGKNQVKATFIFNFAKFVEWPPEAFSRPDEPINVCLPGDGLASELEKVLHGENVNGRQLVVRRISATDTIRGCHVLYLDSTQNRRYPEMQAENLPILTVGETEDFINSGGMIRFIEVGRRIQFQINADAVDHSALKVSSKLLRLAEIVRPKGKR